MKKGITIIILFAATICTAFAGNTDFSISVAEQNNAAVISWTTAKKNKAIRYEVEKSTDGENYFYVTAVAATSKTYTVNDRNYTEGANYYRLKVIAKNGTVTYSKAISISKNCTFNEIKIMPEVVKDELYIWLPANTQVSRAVVTDMSGREINRNFAITNMTNAAALQLGLLPAGMYSVKIITNTGVSSSMKFAKK
ncbi:MAG TPA: T9SS type A sorting domain-containing protein [Ferruginibacter sp.]|nr:T9SS type A sorting domain-containing protein [Ferruginibacter sp.]HMP19691.1 T9SS type A sorting domain-containing protein [Ferruginibacter sp.]